MSSVAGTTYSFYVHYIVPTLVPPPHHHFFFISVTSPQERNLGTGSQVTTHGWLWTCTRSVTRGLWSGPWPSPWIIPSGVPARGSQSSLGELGKAEHLQFSGTLLPLASALLSFLGAPAPSSSPPCLFPISPCLPDFPAEHLRAEGLLSEGGCARGQRRGLPPPGLGPPFIFER